MRNHKDGTDFFYTSTFAVFNSNLESFFKRLFTLKVLGGLKSILLHIKAKYEENLNDTVQFDQTLTKTCFSLCNKTTECAYFGFTV